MTNHTPTKAFMPIPSQEYLDRMNAETIRDARGGVVVAAVAILASVAVGVLGGAIAIAAIVMGG
ncbi:MAG: hypothetical protein IT555_21930 [Acetobacteraceae bacterium]|nr:hypothetical protein [Acetobacteraceae bacterium]